APEQTEIVPEKSETVPEKSETVPEQTETVPEKPEIVPEKPETVPEQTEMTQEQPASNIKHPTAIPSPLPLKIEPLSDVVVSDEPKAIDCAEVGKGIKFKNIYFDFNSYIKISQNKKELNFVRDVLIVCQKIAILIIGHADDVGTSAYNQKLSEKRAKAAVDYLITIGIDPARLAYKGSGEDEPLVPNITEENRRFNRRVEFHVYDISTFSIAIEKILVPSKEMTDGTTVPTISVESESFACAEVGKSIKFSNVNFEFDSYGAITRNLQALKYVKDVLLTCKEIKLTIIGHTDNVGPESYNQKLSEKRAKAAADYLVAVGVDQGRLTYKGYGEQKPLVPNDTKENRLLNRRVEFQITKKL
ncbi:MAG: OmpA family protein, partial [Bacteroidetes bacterium]|nr:OmpA family protein [Bacteroidota bacterium]